MCQFWFSFYTWSCSWNNYSQFINPELVSSRTQQHHLSVVDTRISENRQLVCYQPGTFSNSEGSLIASLKFSSSYCKPCQRNGRDNFLNCRSYWKKDNVQRRMNKRIKYCSKITQTDKVTVLWQWTWMHEDLCAFFVTFRNATYFLIVHTEELNMYND